MDSDEIRNLREELGVSQLELARRLEVSQAAVDRWENGTSAPNGEVLSRLQRLRRFKEFQREGRMLRLSELLTGKQREEGNRLPPWHPDSDAVEGGHLSLVVSPPKCGKTLAALRWAYLTAERHGTPAYYVSTHWTAAQTLRHLERGQQEGETLDPAVPFHLFQHDGKDMTGLLEELSQAIQAPNGVIVVVDWLQNLEYNGERFLREEDKERQLLRDLKTWSTQQGAYVLVIASQRGVERCDNTTFPHFFELADSISVGVLQRLKNRRADYNYQDLHRGGAVTFQVELPPEDELLGGEGASDAPRDQRFRVPTPRLRGTD